MGGGAAARCGGEGSPKQPAAGAVFEARRIDGVDLTTSAGEAVAKNDPESRDSCRYEASAPYRDGTMSEVAIFDPIDPAGTYVAGSERVYLTDATTGAEKRVLELDAADFTTGVVEEANGEKVADVQLTDSGRATLAEKHAGSRQQPDRPDLDLPGARRLPSQVAPAAQPGLPDRRRLPAEHRNSDQHAGDPDDDAGYSDQHGDSDR
ncbi:hypothetical protein [Corynebacterium frankenforstense]|uniref:hypothetical protein n=1 Tax=Corynebacterium frankenforstense TaxID=1230998 RepID=UPI0026F33869|nr:hypothetical protein [Corynebacterium frankenforstense]